MEEDLSLSGVAPARSNIANRFEMLSRCSYNTHHQLCFDGPLHEYISPAEVGDDTEVVEMMMVLR